jgi:hypothetical protein
MIEIYVGLPGAGKSLKTAEKAVNILYRNRRYHKKTGVVRKLYSNIRFAPSIEKEFLQYIEYWNDPHQLTHMRDIDIIWDEIATYLDSTQWKDVPLSLKRWLQQHRKFGIDIYGNTQDFPMIDISMRRLTNRVFLMKKLIGSRDKSATKPNPRKIWGLITMREVDPDSFTDDKTEYKFVRTDWMFIRKKNVAVFDTRQEIEAPEYPPLKKIVRVCPEDGFKRVRYV